MSPNHFARRWPFLLALAVSVTLAFATYPGAGLLATSAATAPPAVALAERSAFSAESALGHLSVLTVDIGSRPAGSAAHDQAIEYVAGAWQSLGLQPVIVPFQFRGFQAGEVSLTLIDSGNRFDGSILRGGIGGNVSGELTDAGLGRAQDVDQRNLQGRIALIRRGEIRFSEKIANVVAAGAIGAVIDNSEPGGFIGTLSGPSPIPSIGISQEDGHELRDQLQFGSVQAQIQAEGGTSELTAANVWASKPGSGTGIVIIGGHIDTVPIGPGANDNGSGVAVITELGRAIQQRSYPFEIRLIAFGAEEVGLIGSSRYVESLSDDDRQRVIGMINLDMVGVGSQWRLGGTPSMVTQAMEAVSNLGESAGRMSMGGNMSSDHASFIEAGIPSVFVHRTDDPNYHTASDRFEAIDPRLIDTAGNIVLALLDILQRDSAA
ncbi:MAG: M20/M25/M40 family metallo-hydrolase [Chloroflexota bacterium]